MIQEVKMYTVICDNCGKDSNIDSEYSCWSDEDSAVDIAKNSDWHVKGDKHYCPDCFSLDDNDNLVITDKRQSEMKTLDKLIALRDELKQEERGEDINISRFDIIKRLDAIIEGEEQTQSVVKENLTAADIRNKLTPIKNLITMLENGLVKGSVEMHDLVIKEIEECKKSITYLSDMNHDENIESEQPIISVFIEWKGSLKSETRLQEVLYDVPKHHKMLNEKELFDYFMVNVYKQS